MRNAAAWFMLFSFLWLRADEPPRTGPVTENMKLALQKTYDAMPAPKIVIAVGACAISGGPYLDHPEVHNGADAVVPVDLYVPGCPPRPEGLLYGIMLLQKKIKGESFVDPTLRVEHLVDDRGLFLAPEKIDEISEPFGNSVHQTRSA